MRLRVFLGCMNDCFKNDLEAMEEINYLLKGLIVDQKNLIEMRKASKTYAVKEVVNNIWNN